MNKATEVNDKNIGYGFLLHMVFLGFFGSVILNYKHPKKQTVEQ